MAIESSTILSLSSLVVAVGALVTPWLASRIKRKADAQTALNQSFSAFTDRLQARCAQLETEVSLLEARIVAIREYSEKVCDRLRHFGEEPPPFPVINGGRRGGG